MKNKVLLLILLFVSISSFSQIKESALIDKVFSEWNQPNVPGCALGIIKDHNLIYAKGYGMANLEYDIPNAPNSVFRIGSTSKQFTAACIILLVEKGKLSLDTSLKDIYPDFPEYANKITIQHLLNHTSGIRDYLQLSFLKGLTDDDFFQDNDVMTWLVNQTDLNFEPGEEFLYSNSGYWLLGQIVNKISGMNMADFAHKEIFEPLKMNHTHFHNDHTQIVKNRASGYTPGSNNNYNISMTTLDMIGDGGIFTTINDIKKWDDAYYNSKVLSKSFWNLMTQQGVLNNGDVIDYASGLMISQYKGLKTIRHGGAFVGFRAELLRFPEQQLTIAIFANRSDANPSEKANQVADILLKDQFIDSPTTTKEKDVNETPKEEFLYKQIVGSYEIQPGVIAKITIKNDSLQVLQTWNNSTYKIAKTSGNTFQIPNNKDISFTFSDLKEGQTQSLSVLQGTTKTLASRKKEIKPSETNLNDYIGDYYSPELNVTYTFELENKTLTGKIENKSPMEGTITDIDQFRFEVGLVKFQRENGVVTGFKLDSGRVINLNFIKQ